MFSTRRKIELKTSKLRNTVVKVQYLLFLRNAMTNHSRVQVTTTMQLAFE